MSDEIVRHPKCGLAARVLAAGGIALAALFVGWYAYVNYEKASLTSRKVTCLQNALSITRALSMYASDYGAFPQANLWESQAIKGYVRSEDMFVCPVAPKLRSGYAYNTALDGASPGAIGDAAKVVALLESDRGWNAAGGRDLLPDQPRHMGGDNVGFADGHAKWWQRCSTSQEDGSRTYLKGYDFEDVPRGNLVWDPRIPPKPETLTPNP